jgi:predicted DNA binding CopG/RHH family protein
VKHLLFIIIYFTGRGGDYLTVKKKNKKTSSVTIRLSEVERDALIKEAKKKGQKLSAYLREKFEKKE